MHRVALACHPATPCTAVQRIEVEVRETADAGLELRYRLDGDIGRLLIPVGSTPRRADRLWQHTCFEAFFAGEAQGPYFEYNLAPSEEWALYRFSAYREGATPVEPAHVPRIRSQASPRRLQLDAEIDAPLAAQRIALSAVVEDVDRRLSYWALVHPLARPDFHHPDAFALRLEHTT